MQTVHNIAYFLATDFVINGQVLVCKCLLNRG